MNVNPAKLALIGLLLIAAANADEPDVPSVSGSADHTIGQADSGLPEFDSDGAMKVPNGYREWIFVGSALGLGYKEATESESGSFSHVYINPFGYRAFRNTGRFPVGTVLMLESVSRGVKSNPALTGYYSDEFTGLEAAVKTGDRFDDPWTYYNFVGENREPLEQVQRVASTSCIECHRQHAETDHVFTQFYPVLRAAAPKP